MIVFFNTVRSPQHVSSIVVGRPEARYRDGHHVTTLRHAQLRSSRKSSVRHQSELGWKAAQGNPSCFLDRRDPNRPNNASAKITGTLPGARASIRTLALVLLFASIFTILPVTDDLGFSIIHPQADFLSSLSPSLDFPKCLARDAGSCKRQSS